jgi:ferredoxin-NADP reductase
MYALPVREIRFFTPDIFELSLERQDFNFESGECAVLFDDTGDSRPYSIASGMDEPVLRFLLRRFSGGALSNWLADRNPGDRIQISPAFGEFRTAVRRGPVVFIATGVGIAPFLSALRSHSFDPEKVTCLYGVRSVTDAVPLPTVDCHIAVSQEKIDGFFQGRVTDLLQQQELDFNADYYLCGCDGMIEDAIDILRERGVSSARIHTEVFFRSKRVA